jgi:CheY-like chemotaxis protein
LQDLITFLANLDAVAFLLLGAVAGGLWLRIRDRSTEQALAAGCAGYIAKPVDTRTLANDVRRHLGAVR